VIQWMEIWYLEANLIEGRLNAQESTVTCWGTIFANELLSRVPEFSTPRSRDLGNSIRIMTQANYYTDK
jgi:hypothetical protein